MKLLAFSLLTILLASCQINDFGNKGEIKSTTVSQDFGAPKRKLMQDVIHDLQVRQQRQETVVEEEPERVSYSFGSNMLVAHSRFAFLAYADMEPTNPEDLEGHKNVYEGESSIFNTFELDDSKKLEYKDLIGTSLMLNDWDRTQLTTRIIDVVLVEDMWNEVPYYAAVLDVPDEFSTSLAWTSGVEDRPHTFKTTSWNVPDDENEEEYSVLEDLSQFDHFNRNYEEEEEVYVQRDLMAFENSKGHKYYIVQHAALGSCDMMQDDMTAVYVEENGELTLLVVEPLGYYVEDLVDLNGDGIPEILGAEFAQSALISIEKGGFNLLNSLSWSTMGCPC